MSFVMFGLRSVRSFNLASTCTRVAKMIAMTLVPVLSLAIFCGGVALAFLYMVDASQPGARESPGARRKSP